MTENNREVIAACFNQEEGGYMVPLKEYQEAKAEIYRLTAALKAARADALREAAEIVGPSGALRDDRPLSFAVTRDVLESRHLRILALIKKEGDA